MEQRLLVNNCDCHGVLKICFATPQQMAARIRMHCCANMTSVIGNMHVCVCVSLALAPCVYVNVWFDSESTDIVLKWRSSSSLSSLLLLSYLSLLSGSY